MKKNPENNISEVLLEARTGFEPVMTVLQTGALPLGYRAIHIKLLIRKITLSILYVTNRIKMTPTGIEPVLPP